MADLKNGKRIQQKVVGILGNCIWIGNGKLSLLLRVYSQLAVNVLTTSPKIPDLIKNNIF